MLRIPRVKGRATERVRPAPNWIVQAEAARSLGELCRDIALRGDVAEAAADGRVFLGHVLEDACPAR